MRLGAALPGSSYLRRRASTKAATTPPKSGRPTPIKGAGAPLGMTPDAEAISGKAITTQAPPIATTALQADDKRTTIPHQVLNSAEPAETLSKTLSRGGLSSHY